MTNIPNHYALAYPEGVRGVQLFPIYFWILCPSCSCAH